ncbi:MAG: hypothetical protein IPL04_17715 [Chitinophagaceae bacterium]|nr:hypothetical protein [Chitinophagaceae bacterium]
MKNYSLSFSVFSQHSILFLNLLTNSIKLATSLKAKDYKTAAQTFEKAIEKQGKDAS